MERTVREKKISFFSLMTSLKACAKTKDLEKGKRIHSVLQNRGLLKKNTYVGNVLVSMYAKCGALARAQEVLEELSMRNVVSWNTLIAGFVQHGQGKEAMECYERMQSEGLPPDAFTYACMLKACGIAQEAETGKEIHDAIVRGGLLEKDAVLGNALVDMYAKCDHLSKAQEVLNGLPVRDVVSWSSLIAGYVQQGQAREALSCFKDMQSEGISPNSITYSCILKACGLTQDIHTGKKIHDEIVSRGLLEKSAAIGNALVGMYAKCGLLEKAQKVLDNLCFRNVVSWNALIVGYAEHGLGKEAVSCFRQMRDDGLSPNASTYVCILKVCGILRDLVLGGKVHDDIVSQGLLGENVVLGNALVDMYAKCDAVTKAREVLDELPVRDVVSWSALISGYAQNGHGKEALECFQRMQSEGLSPDTITYACVLKACGLTQDVHMGEKLRDEMANKGLLEKSPMLGNALVDMYAKCGLFTQAQKVLEEIAVLDIVSWNSLIAEYVQHGLGEGALGCFERMQSEGLFPDAITYVSILKACGLMHDVDKGKTIHDEIISQGLLEKDAVLCNTLVDMYAKCGALSKAQEVLVGLPSGGDVASWNALIQGYAQAGKGKEALLSFERMRGKGLCPNVITYSCILKACGLTLDVNMGKQAHDEIVSHRLLEQDGALGNALVDMYAKWGVLTKAWRVFDELPVRDVVSWSTLITGYSEKGHCEEALDCFKQMKIEGLSPDVVSWNALIEGYAQQGLAEKAFECFQQMQRAGFTPNEVTFASLLNSCSHSGLVEVGQMYLKSMMEPYGIVPDKEHLTCMVDLLGRSRQFDMAISVIKKMPFSDHPPLWSALLSACQKWENMKLGKYAFEHAIQLDGHNSAAYVAMGNIYVNAGM